MQHVCVETPAGGRQSPQSTKDEARLLSWHRLLNLLHMLLNVWGRGEEIGTVNLCSHHNSWQRILSIIPLLQTGGQNIPATSAVILSWWHHLEPGLHPQKTLALSEPAGFGILVSCTPFKLKNLFSLVLLNVSTTRHHLWSELNQRNDEMLTLTLQLYDFS